MSKDKKVKKNLQNWDDKFLAKNLDKYSKEFGGKEEKSGTREVKGKDTRKTDTRTSGYKSDDSRRNDTRKNESRAGGYKSDDSRRNDTRKNESRAGGYISEDSRRNDTRKNDTRKNRDDASTSNGKKAPKKNVVGQPCIYRKQCGGCQYQDIAYEKQIKMKKEQLSTLLKDFCKVKDMIGMEYPYHYRNKVHSVITHTLRQGVTSGIYKAGTHDVIAVENCLIEDAKAGEIVKTITKLMKSFKMKSYDEDSGYGLVRHVLYKRGFASNEIMVVIVTASPIFPSRNNFVKALLKEHPEITTIIHNVNDKQTSMVLGEQEKVMYGKGYIEDTLLGCTFRISSKSFYQVNPTQTEVLYSKALELAALTGKETMIDAYCGIGTIGLIASPYVKEVIGVELNKDAVKDAIANTKRNDIKNANFYQADAGDFMRRLAGQGKSVDVVMMDPPRSGSTEVFIDSVAILAPKKVVYVSCNPETLVRDLKYFKKKGYQAKMAYGVDMFPWTEHVETVCLLSEVQK